MLDTFHNADFHQPPVTSCILSSQLFHLISVSMKMACFCCAVGTMKNHSLPSSTGGQNMRIHDAEDLVNIWISIPNWWWIISYWSSILPHFLFTPHPPITVGFPSLPWRPCMKSFRVKAVRTTYAWSRRQGYPYLSHAVSPYKLDEYKLPCIGFWTFDESH